MQGLGRDRSALSIALTLLLTASGLLAKEAPEAVVFATSDGGSVEADLYGAGSDAVVLAHGAVFDKESWEPLAVRLAGEGHRVLALNFRGYGRSTPGEDPSALHLDVLAAIEFLLSRGADRISLVGASRGANAVGDAASRVDPGRLATVILLAPGRLDNPEAMGAARFVVIASEHERGIDRIRELYGRLPEPKELKLLASDSHAQHVFATEQGPRLTAWIVESLRP